ncbi:MAG: sulfotransferase family protein [Alphaproteobacteria bacterium]|jgi:Sulfotransferase domain|nr:sulfotransferase family protein [Henriciella sp.]MBO6694220.1 sulfotransferase family protein [Henriciella sp.]MCH9751946.1 sulfotransferase family protein [Alphaproteobacteria bacterium]
MALKVIGAGFGRTGTLSMKAALEQLGYDKCHHMLEVFPSDAQLNMWHRISQGDTPDWDAVFDGFQASVDFPSSGYWRELAEHYPDAKIILTTRSFDSWYESANETIWPVSRDIPGWLTVVPKVRKIKQMTYGAIWDRLFGGRFENKEAARQVFEQHEADVKATFPAERLLVFHPKEGWEPLCTFLGKPVPEGDFPNVNDRAEFKKRIAIFKRLRLVPYGLAAIAALIAYLVFR